MNVKQTPGWFVAAAVVTISLVLQAAATGENLAFEVTLDESVASEPTSGRLYVFLSQRDGREPRFGPSWFNPEPFFGLDVRELRPGETRIVDDRADGFPDVVSKLAAGTYHVQAVLDHDFYQQHQAYGVGNLYSASETFDVDPDAPQRFALKLDHVVEPRPFPEGDLLRLVEIKSPRLSKFHGREVLMRCAVALPASYQEDPQRRYPVIYAISGFGGRLETIARAYRDGAPRAEEGEVEFIYVLLSGNCKWGHHVYADSATNGPRGTALIEELIPHLDANFRTLADATARFTTGHSSGGWSSLWLQVTYPDTFGGVWSTSPDPVDFRDYQQVDLYADPPLSLYFDEEGNRRPLARRGETPVIWYETFGKIDDVLGRGGQLRSFEGVFSPLDDRALPLRLWDRTTGRIDPEVAAAWQEYDIRLQLERHWMELEPKLRGKLHIVTGELDTFYLEGAVELLAKALERLGSDAEISIVPGKYHGNVRTAELRRTMRQQMSEAFLKHHPALPSEAARND